MAEKSGGKRVFGWVEVIFDALYLIAALVAAAVLLARPSGEARTLAGIMALILAGGDAFHLVPRMIAAVSGGEKRLAKALGFGKFITSITMTVFYVFLWHLGEKLFAPGGLGAWTAAMYVLAVLRVALCFFPQNKWFDEAPPVDWAVWRNIPFTLMGIMAAVLFGGHSGQAPGMTAMWAAIVLSFAFYLPVVLWAGKNRKWGMLMLPKTCMYLWMLFMCVAAL